MNKICVIIISIILTTTAFANPNNYIGIDEDGNIYELNHGASSGSLNIDEMEHYETYSTQGTDIIFMDMATQEELDAHILRFRSTHEYYKMAKYERLTPSELRVRVLYLKPRSAEGNIFYLMFVQVL